MADNTVLPAGFNGDTIRTIDRSGIKTQILQIDFGGESGPESLATLLNALPIRTGTGIVLPVSLSALPSQGVTPATGTVAGSGTLVTPPAGKTLLLRYYLLNAAAGNAGAISVVLGFVSGLLITTLSLLPGVAIARNIGAGQDYISTVVNDPLQVTVTGAGSLNWAVEYNLQ